MIYVGINGTLYRRDIELKNFSEAIDFMLKEKLGNLFTDFTVEFADEVIPSLQTVLSAPEDSAVQAAVKCAAKNFFYAPIYADFSQKTADYLKAECHKYFLGPIIGEPSCLPVSNWNKEPRLVNDTTRHLNHNAPICFAANMQEAKDTYVKWLGDFIKKYHTQGFDNVILVEPNTFFHYALEAGIDTPCGELLPRRVDPVLSALRGSASAYRKNTWGVWVAIGWYGGTNDGFKDLRFKIALYASYLHGGKIFVQESDHFGITSENQEKNSGLFNELSVKYRHILAEFYEYTQKHKRPRSNPEVSIAFLNGNLDGWMGAKNKYIWGQTKMGSQWEYGPPEEGWNLLDYFYPQSSPYPKLNKNFHFSGAPYGIVDIVPVYSAPLSILKKYKCLIMPSWNTMTETIYQKLLKYVQTGGVLFTGVAQFNTGSDRAREWQLFNSGDLSDLCGFTVPDTVNPDARSSISRHYVKVNENFILGMASGTKYLVPYSPEQACSIKLGKRASAVISFADNNTKPFLIKHTVGKGLVLTFAVRDWIGKSSYNPLIAEIIKSLADAYGIDTKLTGSAWVDWAEYKWDNSFSNIYLLNTDTHHNAKIKMHLTDDLSVPLILPPGALKILHIAKKLVLWASDNQIYFKPSLVNSSDCFLEFEVNCPLKTVGEKIKVNLITGNNTFVIRYDNCYIPAIKREGKLLNFCLQPIRKKVN
ncbi:MAG: hypothetical protein WCS27_07665 [Victivallaceae bacterium]